MDRLLVEHRDSDNQLHYITGPSFMLSNGDYVWAWHGTKHRYYGVADMHFGWFIHGKHMKWPRK